MITAEQYKIERGICDKAHAYADSLMRPGGKLVRNYITAEEAAHPDYAACDNAMRGRVEQYELLTNPPEYFGGYVGKVDGTEYGSKRRALTGWTGAKIGTIVLGPSWRVNSYVGSRMYQAYATMAGREYTGRTFGEGMCVCLRETAASKRKRGVK